MSLLQQIVREMATGAGAVTGAHAVAGSRGSLFGGGIVDPKEAKKKQRKMMRRNMNISEAIAPKSEETKFDAAGVISKIDAAEKKARANDDTTAFGMEDEDGQIVKVYVKNDQAEEFEKALAVALSGEDDNEDDENSSSEIAEVLFQLKDRFEIVDVEWGTFEGDEEEEQDVEGSDEEMDTEGSDVEMDNEEGMGDEDMDADAKSALQSVIDVMKADADAKMAEAKAKEAEANAKEAEYAAQASAEKVKQEEEIMDMEAYNKAESDKTKEAKQLAKLAKYKHDTASEVETELSTEGVQEDEEENTVSIAELSSIIMNNLRAN